MRLGSGRLVNQQLCMYIQYMYQFRFEVEQQSWFYLLVFHFFSYSSTSFYFYKLKFTAGGLLLSRAYTRNLCQKFQQLGQVHPYLGLRSCAYSIYFLQSIAHSFQTHFTRKTFHVQKKLHKLNLFHPSFISFVYINKNA